MYISDLNHQVRIKITLPYFNNVLFISEMQFLSNVSDFKKIVSKLQIWFSFLNVSDQEVSIYGHNKKWMIAKNLQSHIG